MDAQTFNTVIINFRVSLAISIYIVSLVFDASKNPMQLIEVTPDCIHTYIHTFIHIYTYIYVWYMSCIHIHIWVFKHMS